MDQRHGQPDSAVGGLRQITEAFPWDGAYMIRDCDNLCGNGIGHAIAAALVGEGVRRREIAAGEKKPPYWG
jgi:hypothetical protein